MSHKSITILGLTATLIALGSAPAHAQADTQTLLLCPATQDSNTTIDPNTCTTVTVATPTDTTQPAATPTVTTPTATPPNEAAATRPTTTQTVARAHS